LYTEIFLFPVGEWRALTSADLLGTLVLLAAANVLLVEAGRVFQNSPHLSGVEFL
jgi:hypothetical protein